LELASFPAIIVSAIVLGEEYLVGRKIVDRFAVTFDHGQRVIVEP